MCALVPPNPKELMPACLVPSQSFVSLQMKNGDLSNSNRLLGTLQFNVAGIFLL